MSEHTIRAIRESSTSISQQIRAVRSGQVEGEVLYKKDKKLKRSEARKKLAAQVAGTKDPDKSKKE